MCEKPAAEQKAAQESTLMSFAEYDLPDKARPVVASV